MNRLVTLPRYSAVRTIACMHQASSRTPLSIRDALLSDGGIKETLARARGATVAACGIGSLSDSLLVEFGYLDAQKIAFYKEQGIIGDICLRFFDQDGRLRRTDLDDRVIGLTPEELRAIPCVIGIAGGPSKHEALRGALRSGLINACVTDTESAAYVLAET